MLVKDSLSVTILCNPISFVICSVHDIFKCFLKSHISKNSSFRIKATVTVQVLEPNEKLREHNTCLFDIGFAD